MEVRNLSKKFPTASKGSFAGYLNEVGERLELLNRITWPLICVRDRGWPHRGVRVWSRTAVVRGTGTVTRGSERARCGGRAGSRLFWDAEDG